MLWKYLLKSKCRQLLIPVLKELDLQKRESIIKILLQVTDQPVWGNTQMHQKIFTKHNLSLFFTVPLTQAHSKLGLCNIPGNDLDKLLR